MKLYYAKTSPFVRKVLLSAHVLGLEKEIEKVNTDVFGDSSEYKKKNPLVRIPAFETRTGEMLVNSPFICQYLASLKSGQTLFPNGPDLWSALNIQAIADGGCDSAVLRRQERALRKPDRFDESFDNRQKEKVYNALEFCENNLYKLSTRDLTISEISIICFVDYVTFRHGHERWDIKFPRLFNWVAKWNEMGFVRETFPS